MLDLDPGAHARLLWPQRQGSAGGFLAPRQEHRRGEDLHIAAAQCRRGVLRSHPPRDGCHQMPNVLRGYAAVTSVMTFTRYGTPEANARSSAGPSSRGSVIISPPPPSAVATWS